MNKDDIIRMAEQAGMERCKCDPRCHLHTGGMGSLTYFANLVAAAEREACAKVCDKEINPNADKHEPVSQYQSGCYITAEFLAATIRARKVNE
jgi:hypothetical protein